MHVPLAIIINDDVFQDLSGDQQQVLYDGVREIQPQATETLEANLADHRSFMEEKGLTIVPPEDQRWTRSARPSGLASARTSRTSSTPSKSSTETATPPNDARVPASF